MIGTLLARNLRRHLILTLALFGGLVGLEAFVVYVASQLGSGPDLISLIHQLLPPSMADWIASQVGLTFGGMVAFGFQHPIVLVASIGLTILVATTPAAERESGFLDLILARPLRRRHYLLAILIQIVFCALILPAALVLGVAIGLQVVEVAEEARWLRFVGAGAGLSALLLCIGGYTLLFASMVRRRGSAVALSVGLTLVFFWLDVTAQLWAPLRKIQWLSPFSHFEPIQAPLSGMLILWTAFVVAVALAWVSFERQDL